jgi:uncharacterized SAM-binding protein YcdF (DUF218 family)
VARVVAVLGYSTWRGDGLHPICVERLEAAQQVAQDADTVFLSGWSRRRHRPSEAELMRQAWLGPDVTLLADGDSRTTIGNALALARAAKELGADEVVLVTSTWHARRSRLLARAVLPPDVRLTMVTPPRTRPPGLIARELAALLPSRLAVRLRRR